MSQPFATKSTLFEAIELINSGRILDAEAICRAAVERNEHDVNMTALLGATLFKAGKNQEAEKYLRISTQLAPNFAKPWSDLGAVLVETRRPREAAEVLENAVRLDPAEGDAWFNLGKVRSMLGLGPEADEAFEKAFELNPERKALAHAAEHQQAGRLEEAEKVYREILRKNPENVDALRLLGTLAVGSGRAHEAEGLFRRVIAYAPDYAEAHLDLGRILKDQHRLEEAIQSFEKVIELEPHSMQANLLLASVLAPAARTHDAIAAYRKVLELRPNHPGALLGLGHTLKTVGQQDEAVQAYRDCIGMRPGNGETYWSLANLKTFKLSDEDIQAMESQVARQDMDEDLNTQSRVNFLFALAKAYEDRGDFDRAWAYYEEGNSTQRLEETYDPVRTEVMNDEIIKVFDSGFLAQHSGTGNPSPEPIFIIGLPRSGSTLLEQILASHSMVEGTAELPYAGIVANSMNRNRADGVNYPRAVRELSGQHFHRLGQKYLDLARIHRTEGKPRFIDKMPNNFPAVGLLHLILPNCKIIDARRYPMDSCLSCYRQLFARGQSFTYDLTDIGEYFLEYQRMMDYWHEVLPGRCLTMQYEDLVMDFDSQVRRLLEFCELPWEENCARFYATDRPVRTASSEQVRQPVYSRSINFWRNHESHLAELKAVLKPVLPRYAQYEHINRQGKP
jgi:tetratricopeptide (TPR) repeat protein